MKTEQVTYLSGDGSTALEGYVAAPDGPGPYPAILVLRGVAGPEDGYVEICERLASWGLFAFLHGWKLRGDDPPDRPVEQDLEGAKTFLLERADVDTARLGVFGFCRGGVHALMAAAAHPEFRAAAVFHGFAFRPEQAQPGLQPFDLVEQVDVPVFIQHGTDDVQAPIEGMRKLEARAKALGKNFHFKYYNGVPHGFAVRTHPGFERNAAEASFAIARSFVDEFLTRTPKS